MKKIQIKRKIFPIIAWSLLALWCLSFVLVFFWVLITSFKTGTEFMLSPFSFPKKWQFSNYATAIKNIYADIPSADGSSIRVGFVRLLLNSLLYAVGTSFFAVLTASMSSYVVAKYNRFKWVSVIFGIVVFTTFVPLSASLASNIKLVKDLGLFDSMIGMYILSSGAFGMMFLYYYATFKTVPWSFAEAAFIDGASHFYVFRKIMLPLTIKTFGALFLISFINVWNDYLTPLIYLPSYPTLSYGAWKIQYATETEFAIVPVQLAGLMTVLVPILAIFLIFRKRVIGAMTLGGLKG